jgi:hypothetical protein
MFEDGTPSQFKQLACRAKGKELYVFAWTDILRIKDFSGCGLVIEP